MPNLHPPTLSRKSSQPLMRQTMRTSTSRRPQCCSDATAPRLRARPGGTHQLLPPGTVARPSRRAPGHDRGQHRDSEAVGSKPLSNLPPRAVRQARVKLDARPRLRRRELRHCRGLGHPRASSSVIGVSLGRAQWRISRRRSPRRSQLQDAAASSAGVGGIVLGNDERGSGWFVPPVFTLICGLLRSTSSSKETTGA